MIMVCQKQKTSKGIVIFKLPVENNQIETTSTVKVQMFILWKFLISSLYISTKTCHVTVIYFRKISEYW